MKGLDTWQFKENGKVYKVSPKARLVTDNGEVVRDASVQGIGVSLLSTWCAYEKLLSGELVQILEDYPLVSNTKNLGRLPFFAISTCQSKSLYRLFPHTL